MAESLLKVLPIALMLVVPYAAHAGQGGGFRGIHNGDAGNFYGMSSLFVDGNAAIDIGLAIPGFEQDQTIAGFGPTSGSVRYDGFNKVSAFAEVGALKAGGELYVTDPATRFGVPQAGGFFATAGWKDTLVIETLASESRFVGRFLVSGSYNMAPRYDGDDIGFSGREMRANFFGSVSADNYGESKIIEIGALSTYLVTLCYDEDGNNAYPCPQRSGNYWDSLITRIDFADPVVTGIAYGDEERLGASFLRLIEVSTPFKSGQTINIGAAIGCASGGFNGLDTTGGAHGSARCDMSHSAYWMGGKVIDGAGNIVTGISARSGSGFNFLEASPLAPRVDAVPEPANWVMLIAGFGLVGACQRRRRITRQADISRQAHTEAR